MLSIIKRSILAAVSGCGYAVIKSKQLDDLTRGAPRHSVEARMRELDAANASLRTENENLKTKLEMTHRSRARLDLGIPLDSLIDYQVELAKYYIKTAMGDIEPVFSPLYERSKSLTTASVEELYAIHSAINYIVQAGIPGDIVDCGSGRGGATMMALLTLQASDIRNRRVLMLDSFDELPSEFDEVGRKHASGSESAVREALAATNYPSEFLHIHKGMIERTVANLPTQSIALLRLDTDCYSSTKVALAALFPRVASGGVLLVSDCGPLLGPHKAVVDYCAETKQPLLLSRVDYSSRIAVKPGKVYQEDDTIYRHPTSA